MGSIFDVIDGYLGLGSAGILNGVAVSIGGVESKTESFERSLKFVIGESSFELVACFFGG